MTPIFKILSVQDNKKLGSYRKVTFKDRQMCKLAGCGNFIMIGFSSIEPYLPRPFSFLDVDREFFSVLVKVKGEGTERLSKVREGVNLRILGPLGKNFCPPKQGVLIAGGIGIAPVYYQSKQMNGGILFYGVKDKNDLVLTNDFKKRGFKVRVITEEDGGLVTDLVKKHSDELNEKKIFICGPNEMIFSVKNILSRKQIDNAYVYMEERMGCGLGGCKSCAVNTTEGYKLLCTEGPIFPLREVRFG